MITFVDTSFLLPLLDADDDSHERAALTWDEAVARDRLVTSNYVLTEAASVCQRRLGMPVLRGFLTSVVPLLEVHWVDRPLHDTAVAILLGSGRRDLSLVDCTSFEIMGRLGIRRAFALDKHFAEQGFECMP